MDSAQIEFTVVVPVYNGEATISACLNSLINQDISENRYHIVVVNNGSNDNTQGILDEYEGVITVVHEAVRGPAAARNCGIQFCASSIVAFIDADCVADPGWLRYLSLQFENQNIVIVGGKILAMPGYNSIQKFGERIHNHKKAIEDCKPPYLISMNLAIKHNILDRTGLFDTKYRRGEDVDLAWRLAKEGYKFHYSNDSVIYHHNESTLPGLFREGFQHGFYGVQLLKQYEEFLYKLNGKRDIFTSLRRAFKNLMGMLVNEGNRRINFYETIFNSGKLCGSVLGSIRFRYLQF